MYYLPYVGIGISLVGIGFLVLRAWRRIVSLPPGIVPPEVGLMNIWARLKEYWRKIQPALMAFLTRFLHRSRIMTLKTDNRLSQWIESVRNRSRLVSTRSRSWLVGRSLARKTQPRISFAELAEVKLKTKEEELLKRVTDDPKNPAPYAELADLYEKMGNTEDAREARLTAEKLTSRR